MGDPGIRVEERRCIRCGRTELHEVDGVGNSQCIRCRVLAEERAKAPPMVTRQARPRSNRVLGLDLDDPVRVIGTILILGIGIAMTTMCLAGH